jgi:Flp pilus assembly pilin Flp
MTFLKNFCLEEDGQDMVEYGLILALIVGAAVTIYTTLGGKITAGLGGVMTAIGNAL